MLYETMLNWMLRFNPVAAAYIHNWLLDGIDRSKKVTSAEHDKNLDLNLSLNA